MNVKLIHVWIAHIRFIKTFYYSLNSSSLFTTSTSKQACVFQFYLSRYLRLLYLLPPLDKYYQRSSSSLSTEMSFTRHFAISVAVHFGQNFTADRFYSSFFSSWLVVANLEVDIAAELFDQSTSSQYATVLLEWCCLCQHTLCLQYLSSDDILNFSLPR